MWNGAWACTPASKTEYLHIMPADLQTRDPGGDLSRHINTTNDGMQIATTTEWLSLLRCTSVMASRCKNSRATTGTAMDFIIGSVCTGKSSAAAIHTHPLRTSAVQSIRLRLLWALVPPLYLPPQHFLRASSIRHRTPIISMCAYNHRVHLARILNSMVAESNMKNRYSDGHGSPHPLADAKGYIHHRYTGVAPIFRAMRPLDFASSRKCWRQTNTLRWKLVQKRLSCKSP